MPSPIRLIATTDYSSGVANPYLRLLYHQLDRQGVVVEPFRPAALLVGRKYVWHLHWPELFVNSRRTGAALCGLAKFIVYIGVARARRCPIVWTAHNLRGHDRRHPLLERILFLVLCHALSGTIHLGEEARRQAFATYPQLSVHRNVVIRHGHYRDWYEPVAGREESRIILGIDRDSKVLLFFGNIRPYKGVERLVRAFMSTADREFRLIVAGRPLSAAIWNVLRECSTVDRRLILLESPTDAQLPVIFGAADLVCLPFNNVLNSGSAMAALSFDRPVMLPDIPVFRELKDSVGDGWVRPFASLTAEEIDEALASDIAPEGKPDLRCFEWPGIGSGHARFYVSLFTEEP